MKPTNVAASTSSSNTGDADGASSGKVSGGGEPIVHVKLPLHLTERILRNIAPLESARFATVCKSWAGIVSARLATPVPALFVRLPPKNCNTGRRGLVVSVPLEGAAGGSPRLPPAAIPAHVHTHGLRCIGAVRSRGLAFAGWHQPVVAVNPVTGAWRSVKLGEPDHVLVAGTGGGEDAFVSSANASPLVRLSWKPAGGEWAHRTVAPSAVPPPPSGIRRQRLSSAVRFTGHVLAAVKCNGCFYMLRKDGWHVSVVDVAAPPPLRMETVEVPGLAAERRPYFRSELGHMLESNGEVLYVRRLVQYEDLDPASPAFCEHNNLDRVIVGFEVYRLDMEGQQRRWTRVERLAGDQALFVSDESSFSVASSETAGCRSNCIYYARKIRYCLCRETPVSWHVWGAYSLEDQELLFEHPFIETSRCEAALWFLA